MGRSQRAAVWRPSAHCTGAPAAPPPGQGEDDKDNRYEFAIAAYDRSGKPVSCFGSKGRVRSDWGSLSAFAESAVLLPDGRLVVAGFARDLYAKGQPDRGIVMARYNSDGRLDPSFGRAGQLRYEVGEGQSGSAAIAVRPDGRLLTQGWAEFNTGFESVLVQFLADGGIDHSFGSDGVVRSGVQPSAGITVQPDGKILEGARIGPAVPAGGVRHRSGSIGAR